MYRNVRERRYGMFWKSLRNSTTYAVLNQPYLFTQFHQFLFFTFPLTLEIKRTMYLKINNNTMKQTSGKTQRLVIVTNSVPTFRLALRRSALFFAFSSSLRPSSPLRISCTKTHKQLHFTFLRICFNMVHNHQQLLF